MLPLLPFAAGLFVGAAAIKLVKKDRTRERLDQAQTRLREATVSGLSAIEHSSARLREKLATPAAPQAEAVAPAAESVPAPAPRKRAPRRTTSTPAAATRTRKRTTAES
ncbi:MAG: hypothetical protein QM639_05810 [Rhodocyclaceae bacterium]